MSEDFGIKVSQEGFDVRTCADKDLLFSSAFPSLNILFEGVKTVSAEGEVIFTHNLGYSPAFLAFDIDTGAMAHCDNISCDMNQLVHHGTDTATFKYYIFNWDLKTTYLSPVSKNVSSIGELNKDFGIKISKEGFDVRTCGLKDQVLNSGGRTPMIHQSGIGSSPSSVDAVITHNLGYIPMFLAYISYYGDGSYYLRSIFGESALGSDGGVKCSDCIIDKNKITLNSPLPGIGGYSYIIFKDPTEVL